MSERTESQLYAEHMCWGREGWKGHMLNLSEDLTRANDKLEEIINIVNTSSDQTTKSKVMAALSPHNTTTLAQVISTIPDQAELKKLFDNEAEEELQSELVEVSILINEAVQHKHRALDLRYLSDKAEEVLVKKGYVVTRITGSRWVSPKIKVKFIV